MKAKNYLLLLLIVSLSATCSFALNRLGVDKQNILMVYLVGVLLVTAFTNGYLFGLIAALTSVMMFNYFFTEPLHTFAINSPNDIALLVFFFIASALSSSMTARFRKQLLISQKNERTAKVLYDVSLRLRKVSGEENISRQGMQFIKEYTGYESTVRLHENNRIFSFKDNSSENQDSDEIFQKPDNAGLKAELKAEPLELPIMGITRELGVLSIIVSKKDKNAGRDKMSMETEWMFNTVAAQMGVAIDREHAYNEREKIKVEMEKEHLKSNLLRSVSHDLRTPLTGIAAASSYISQKCDSLERSRIGRLAQDINEQAEWLTTMVGNILHMTRIGSGKIEITKDLEVAEDVVNEAVSHVAGLKKRPFKVNLPEELIAAPMDGKLITQVLINLLDNATVHTPQGTPIELNIFAAGGSVIFSVEDAGTGVEPSLRDNIFDAFVTSGKTSADGKKGMGLGLAISKAIVESHGGEIKLDVSHLGGARFSFNLPMENENVSGGEAGNGE